MPKYTEEEQALANEFATKLDDHDSIAWHLSLIRNYEEWSLRKQLKKALDIPEHKVRTTRAQIYNSLVQHNGVLKDAGN